MGGGIHGSMPEPEPRSDGKGLNRTCFGCFEGKNRTRKIVATVTILILGVVGIVLLAVGVQSRSGAVGAKSGGAGGADGGHHDMNRLDAIKKRIVASGVTLPSSLEGEVTSGSETTTAQHRALQWLAFADPKKVDPEDDFLLQRYGLAVLWFATHPELEGGEEGGTGEISNANGRARKLRSATATKTEPLVASQLVMRQLQRAEDARDGEQADEGKGGDDASSGTTVASEHEGTDSSNAAHHWTTRTDWMTDKGICSWHGIRCHPRPEIDESDDGKNNTAFDADGMVTHLVLPDNHIGGELPGELFAALTEVEVIDLGGNALRGMLPPDEDMAHAIRLQTLILRENNLSGPIPPAIQSFESLVALDLGFNDFTGTIPGVALSKLSDTLEGLALQHNQLTGTVPADLGNLVNLHTLYLDTNKLGGTVPVDLRKLHKLRDLRLRENALVGSLPSDLSTIKSLEILYLDNNDLTGPLPESYSDLKSLGALGLHDNAFTGTVPESWSQIPNLRHLYLDGNKLNGNIPSTWGEGMTLKKLHSLYMSRNELGGPIPPGLGGLSSLQELHLARNNFTGNIPPELGSLQELVHLALEGNNLVGPIPTELGTLSRLVGLNLQENDGLEGEMPPSICSLRTEGSLETLTVNCEPGEEGPVKCNCCTECTI